MAAIARTAFPNRINGTRSKSSGYRYPTLKPKASEQGIYLPLDGSMALDDMDRFIIKTALERADNNLTAAARALGATRETLRYRVRKYNLKTVD